MFLQEDIAIPQILVGEKKPLHVHLLPKIFYNSTQSNYIPQKWKQSSNIWILTEFSSTEHCDNHSHTSDRWTAACFIKFFGVQTLDVDSKKNLVHISNDLVYETAPWKIMALLMIDISRMYEGQQGWKYISMLLNLVSTTDRTGLCPFIHC